MRRIWARETFDLCEKLWRQDITPDLEGLEQLAESVQLMPSYDLFDSLANPDDDIPEAWKETVYDYRWLGEAETRRMGFPTNT